MFETTAEFAYIEHLLGFASEPPLGPPRLRARRQPAAEAVPHRRRLHVHPSVFGSQLARLLRFRRAPGVWSPTSRFFPLAERVAHLGDAVRIDRSEGQSIPPPHGSRSATGSAFPRMPVLSLEELPRRRA